MKRRFLLLVIVVSVLLLGSAFAVQRQIASRSGGEWQSVKQDDLLLGVEVIGQLEAADTVLLGPPSVTNVWEYKISMLIPEGTDVTPGTPVMAFDTDELQRELEKKSSEAESAKKEIEKTEADLALRSRDEKLKLAEAEARLRKAELKLTSPETLAGAVERRQIEIDRRTAGEETAFRRARLQNLGSSARAEILILRTKFEEASQRVAEIQENLDRMTVKAPRAGSVGYVRNWRDEKKKVGDSCWYGEKILEIPDLTKLRGVGEVDEGDSARVKVGQRALLRLDALPDEEIAGKVIEVGRTVQRRRGETNPVKVLTVRIALDKVNREKLRPGMRFQGTLETQRLRDVVLAPAEALHWDGGQIVALKQTLIGSVRQAVEIGQRNEKSVQIVSGLEAGDKVLVRRDSDDEEKAK